MQQMNLFEATYEKPSFPSHIKLIELFAGIGAQFKSLKALGVDVESHRTCEWSWQSIIAYNAIHHDGEIADTSHMTYQEVLDFIEGVSHDYNKPMTRKNLERRGEEWCRKVAGASSNLTGGVTPTLCAKMGKGWNFVWITESNSPGRSTDTDSVKPTTSTRSKG